MTRTRSLRRRFVDWMFRSRETGEIVLGQWPNLTASVTWVAAIVALVTRSDSTRRTAAQVVVVSGAWWALRELFSGVNPFRRLQGAAALGAIALLARD